MNFNNQEETSNKMRDIIFRFLDCNVIKKIRGFFRNKFVFYALCILNVGCVFCLILFPLHLIASLFLLANLLFIFFGDIKEKLLILFLIYPLAKVLKFPGISTSLVTILIFIFILFQAIRCFVLEKQSINEVKIIILFVFILYCLLTFLVSMFNFQGFSLNNLLSYYLYLFLPVCCCVFISNKNAIDGADNIIFLSTSFLIGIIFTMVIFHMIPNGSSYLKNAGVNVFNMGLYGVRYSPLCDDPNYGTASIALISSLFFCVKKTKKQSIIGYPIILASLIFNFLSLSKMFILCVLIILISCLLRLINYTKSIAISLILFISTVTSLFFLLSTSFGNTLFIRFFGTKGVADFNRITSGRTKLFGEYSSYLLSKPHVLLFGKGPLFNDLNYFSSGEHNTFTKNLLGNGLFGISAMLLFSFLMLKISIRPKKVYFSNPATLAFLIILFICSMSLCISPATVFPLVLLVIEFCEFLPIYNKQINGQKNDIMIEVSV